MNNHALPEVLGLRNNWIAEPRHVDHIGVFDERRQHVSVKEKISPKMNFRVRFQQGNRNIPNSTGTIVCLGAGENCYIEPLLLECIDSQLSRNLGAATLRKPELT